MWRDCALRDDMENSLFHRPTTALVVIGFFVKTVPTWIRLVHVFNCCQISVWTIDLLLLPDCNASGLRWIVCKWALVLVLPLLVVEKGVLSVYGAMRWQAQGEEA